MLESAVHFGWIHVVNPGWCPYASLCLWECSQGGQSELWQVCPHLWLGTRTDPQWQSITHEVSPGFHVGDSYQCLVTLELRWTYLVKCLICHLSSSQSLVHSSEIGSSPHDKVSRNFHLEPWGLFLEFLHFYYDSFTFYPGTVRYVTS